MAVIAVATLSLVSLIGYSYQASSLYQVGSYVPMAIHTAAAFAVLAVGILLARPHRGVMSVVLDRGAGGVMAKRLLPAVIIIPWLLGALRLYGQHKEYYDTEIGAALLVAVTAMLFVVTVGWIASAVTRSDVARKQAMDELQRSSAEIFDLYNRAPCGYHSLDENGGIIAINDTELAWLGYERDEVVGKMHFADFVASPHTNFSATTSLD